MATRIAALDVGDSVQRGFDGFFQFLPNLLGFLVILVAGYFVAKVVQAGARTGLEKVGLDKALHDSDAGRYVERVSPGARPSSGVARLVFWLIFLFVLVAAIGALKIPAVTGFMNQVLAYLPNVIVAVVIFVLASAVAGAVAGLVQRTMGDTPTGKLVRAAIPGLVLAIAIFMILNQLRIAPEIVTITYAALLGAIALGMALAFGLGGRDIAGQMLAEAYQRGREQSDQVRSDLQTGKERAQSEAQRARTQVEPQGEGSRSGSAAGLGSDARPQT